MILWGYRKSCLLLFPIKHFSETDCLCGFWSFDFFNQYSLAHCPVDFWITSFQYQKTPENVFLKKVLNILILEYLCNISQLWHWLLTSVMVCQSTLKKTHRMDSLTRSKNMILWYKEYKVEVTKSSESSYNRLAKKGTHSEGACGGL